MVKKQKLTFCVSGQLWNRSLVMMDVETKTLWSHILGEAMQGKLKGTQLQTLPADLVTWKAWKKQHPKTSLLNLSRTSRNYTREFYRRPGAFVLGFVLDGKPYHASFAFLKDSPLVNFTIGKQALLLTYEEGSTAARLFSRSLDGMQLTFIEGGRGTLKDKQTGSIWNRSTGVAISGKLKGKALKTRVGIPSFTRAWQRFHPKSRAIQQPSEK